jgi:hypothetical protein
MIRQPDIGRIDLFGRRRRGRTVVQISRYNGHEQFPDEAMEVRVLVDTLAPIPTTSFLVGKGGSRLFRTTQAMPRDERNPPIDPAMRFFRRIRVCFQMVSYLSPASRNI